MKNPKITVLLPTYNRPGYLMVAIKSVLIQDLPDFEMLILDDASTISAQSAVESLHDTRITYKRNKKNVGYATNLKNGFKKAKGKYIFILSDDDIIVHKNTFSTIYQEMEKHKAGYAQTGLMYYDTDPYRPSVLDHVASKLIYQPPSENILIKTINWHYGFMSGNVFRKDFISIEQDLHDADIWWPYLRATYRALKTHGGIYFGKQFILARTSTSGLVAWLDIKKNGSFYMDLLFEIFKEFDSDPKRFSTFLKKKLDIVVGTLAGIKYYTSNQNIKEMAYAIIKKRPQYIFETYFWFNVLAALLTPKLLLRVARSLRTIFGQYRLNNISKQIKLHNNLQSILE